MFHFPTGRFALPELPADGASRLTGAVMLSIAAHALLLAWPVSLPSGGTGHTVIAGAAKPPRTLRVSLRVVPEAAESAATENTPAEKASIAEPLEDKAKDAPQGEQVTQGAVPLIGYYPAVRLTRMPEAIGLFDIKPPAGGDTGIGGKMTVRIWIGANGAIDQARVLSSGLPQAYTDAALAAFENLRFTPGQIDGLPVKSWAEVVIEYADFRDQPQPGAR